MTETLKMRGSTLFEGKDALHSGRSLTGTTR